MKLKKPYEPSPRLKIKPGNYLTPRGEENRYVTENPELILNYPPRREHELVMFWNENRDDYNQLIEDFSELLNMNKVIIELTDNKAEPTNYNNDPQNEVSQHMEVNGFSWIAAALQNVSNLCHELSHAVDMTYDDNQLSTGKFSQISKKVQEHLPLIFNEKFKTFKTHEGQLIYELKEKEIFARALNQHYLRARGDNIFAQHIKPQISDYVIDFLYEKDEKFRNDLNEYFKSIPEIAKWGEPENKRVIHSKFVSDEDYKDLISELNRLTELNKPLEM